MQNGYKKHWKSMIPKELLQWLKAVLFLDFSGIQITGEKK